MYNPEEELRAIMDLLAEWRSKTGTGDVSIYILADGHGRAYNWESQPARAVWIEMYKASDSLLG